MNPIQVIGIVLIFMCAVLIVQTIRILLLERAQRHDRYALEVMNDLLKMHRKSMQAHTKATIDAIEDEKH